VGLACCRSPAGQAPVVPQTLDSDRSENPCPSVPLTPEHPAWCGRPRCITGDGLVQSTRGLVATLYGDPYPAARSTTLRDCSQWTDPLRGPTGLTSLVPD
jgi:hypothetical protein